MKAKVPVSIHGAETIVPRGFSEFGERKGYQLFRRVSGGIGSKEVANEWRCATLAYWNEFLPPASAPTFRG
jgi:hypothetical protein